MTGPSADTSTLEQAVCALQTAVGRLTAAMEQATQGLTSDTGWGTELAISAVDSANPLQKTI